MKTINKSEEISQLKQPYELDEYQQKLLDRYKEEIDYRLGVKCNFDIYTENFLSYPNTSGDYVTFELQAGNWKRVKKIMRMELENSHSEVFYYFLRQIIDETMSDLLKRGANTY